ncbi:Histone-lysine N-methyltransferase SETMAR [Eumeta japonica]|uniref:Histone-lysine N-methyltransferase SETMAR n=1 Tax=Eumeta variegata TaxID=151549 RepID=A0A4C1YUQ1_EUMVA|nr:Histone-lysine N-methyltransferase SETMAR [Eumeta japonica]
MVTATQTTPEESLVRWRPLGKHRICNGGDRINGRRKREWTTGPLTHWTKATAEATSHPYFLRCFKPGNFDIKDEPRTGRRVTGKVDAILEKVEQDWHISSYDTNEELEIDGKTVLTHSQKAGDTKKLDTWVPHEFNERNLMNCVLIYDSLFKHEVPELLLKRLITGDEKWIIYEKTLR